ncbi:RND family transporter [Halobacteriovorax sp.]|uniref:efflux RND transporter permease subunit n=1 Tax=Halobacteriovorax sp. TaxID=2020862 RepID=UPI0035697D31
MHNQIRNRLVNFVVLHKHICLLLAALIFLSGLPFLVNTKMDFSAKVWFASNDPNIKTLEVFEKTFGNDESATLIIESDTDVFNPKFMTMLEDLTQKMWKVPEVMRVQSLTNFYWTRSFEDEILTEEFLYPEKLSDERYLLQKREEALAHKVIPGYYVSDDGKSASIYAFISHNPDKAPDYAVITEGLKKITEEYRDEEGITFHYMGQPPLSDRFQKVSFDDLFTMSPLLLLLVMLYLVYCFRSVIGVVIPTVIIALSLISTTCLIGLFGFTVNSLTFVLPSILIAISVADSVHLMASFYDEFAKTGDRFHACTHTLRKNLWPIFLTTFSTMIGFFSLTSSDIKPVADLGVLAGIGTFFAFLYTYLTAVPLLIIFNKNKTPTSLKGKVLSEDSVRSYLDFVKSYRLYIIAGFLVVSSLFTYLAIKNEINSDPYTYFSKDDPISKGNRFVLKSYGGVGGPELIVDSGVPGGVTSPEFLYKVESFQDWLEEKEYVNKSLSVINILKEMNQSLNEGKKEFFKIPERKDQIAQELFMYTMSLPVGMDLNNRMDLSQQKLRLSILWSLQTSKDSLLGVEDYEKKAQEMGLDIKTTGKPILFHRMNSYVVYTFFTSIAMALTLITIIMILIFKNIKLGLLSLIPNVLPIIFGAGALTLLDKPIDIGCAIVASVTLGIAVDDTIHFLSHYNLLRRSGLNIYDSMVKVFTSTGLALIVTTIILVSCFGLFMFANLTPNINFGILCALVLSIALITDLLLLPAIIFCFKDQD